MEYQKKLRMVLCLLCMSAAVCLTGCRASFGGCLPGGKEELVFTCGEADPAEEGGVTDRSGNSENVAEEGTAAGGAGNPEDAAAKEGIAGGGTQSSGNAAFEAEAPPAESGDEDSRSSETAETSGITADGRVDLNTADLEELMTLNGIGETRARAIIEYRTQNGPFTKEEDIMQITGIKEGIYTKIQDQIIVR